MNASTGKAGAATVSSPSDTPPRSIVVRFMSFRNKEEIIKMRRGFEYEGRKVYLNHDYAPDELKKHKEYCMQRQKSLEREENTLQTLLPAKLRMFYEGEIRIYNTAEEATVDMVRRGLKVTVVKPTENGLDRIKHLTWQVSRADKSQTPWEIDPGFKQKLKAFKRN